METVNVEVKRGSFQAASVVYSRRDGVIALVYCIYIMVFIYLLGLLMFKTSYINDLSSLFPSKQLFKLLFYIPLGVIQLLPLYLLLSKHKQSLRTIGITRNKILVSLIIGLAAVIPFNFMQLFGYFTHKASFHLQGLDALWELLYFFICIALVEELIFRGYIQPRLIGLIRNRFLALLTGSMMFAFLHIPFQMVKAGVGMLEFVSSDWPHLITTGVMHLFFYFLYTRTNNILTSTVPHGLGNFIQTNLY